MEDYMSFRLPTADHPAREYLGDMSYLAEVLHPGNVHLLPDFASALRTARKHAAVLPAGSRVNTVCLRADDERWLISVGPRGGWKKLWNFGTGRD
jgi:hypothetical protein